MVCKASPIPFHDSSNPSNHSTPLTSWIMSSHLASLVFLITIANLIANSARSLSSSALRIACARVHKSRTRGLPYSTKCPSRTVARFCRIILLRTGCMPKERHVGARKRSIPNRHTSPMTEARVGVTSCCMGRNKRRRWRTGFIHVFGGFSGSERRAKIKSYIDLQFRSCGSSWLHVSPRGLDRIEEYMLTGRAMACSHVAGRGECGGMS